MHWTAWPFMLSMATIPVIGLLLFIKVISRGREKLPWEHRANYLAYGALAILLVCIVLGKLVFY
jgi:hypothetical protein